MFGLKVYSGGNQKCSQIAIAFKHNSFTDELPSDTQ